MSKLSCSGKEEKGEECVVERTTIKLLIVQFSPVSTLLPPFQPNCFPQHPTSGYPLSMPKSRSNPGKTDPGIRSPRKDFKESATAYEAPADNLQ
jgi:hypothetical protein